MKISGIEKEAIKLGELETPTDVVGKLKLYSALIIMALKFTKIFVGPKADAKIDEAIEFLQTL